ncbi:hypothetical protein [Jiangella asiatica]|uniref:DUF3168 domain-containing protein n=1 Tax=Jiangella asiatica TaxID=2530372 RepID=A0A4R5CRH5_9ACTN|nr:hypothetical protein [Jiangella asiatica]TDE02836.1 hypothetical protein E1269_21330 [Jiangella asiatica]
MLAGHVAAVKLLLAAVGFVDITDGEDLPPGSIALYDGQVPKEPTFPYVVLWTTPGDRTAPALSNEHTQFETRLYTTYAGASADAVRFVADKVSGTLLDVRPIVAGRSCWKLATLYSEPIRQDSDVTLPGTNLHPMYGVDVWRLASVPA